MALSAGGRTGSQRGIGAVAAAIGFPAQPGAPAVASAAITAAAAAAANPGPLHARADLGPHFLAPVARVAPGRAERPLSVCYGGAPGGRQRPPGGRGCWPPRGRRVEGAGTTRRRRGIPRPFPPI